MSASVLVTKPHEFGQWAEGVKLDPRIKETIPTDQSFDSIRDIQHASKIIPQWASDKNSPPLLCLAPRYDEQIDAIRDGLQEPAPPVVDNALDVISLSDGIPGLATVDDVRDQPDTDLCASIGMILETSRHHERLFRRRDLPLNEGELRISIDNMLNHIYDTDSGNVCISHTVEQQLKLPSTAVASVSVPFVTPGAVDLMSFHSLPLYRDHVEVCEAAACLYQAVPPQDLHVIHCVTDYNKSGSQSRVLMGIVSGLYQRRALGMKDQFVFGVSQNLGNFLRVVTATWQGEMIEVYNLGTYSLRNPRHTLECYLLLRGIKRLGDSYYEIIRQAGENPNPSVVQKASSMVWAPYATSRPQTPDPSPHNDDRGREQKAPGLNYGEISATFKECQYKDKVLGFLEKIRSCGEPLAPPEGDEPLAPLEGEKTVNYQPKECNYQDKVLHFLETIRSCGEPLAPPEGEDTGNEDHNSSASSEAPYKLCSFGIPALAETSSHASRPPTVYSCISLGPTASAISKKIDHVDIDPAMGDK